jgi:hypothetical protein
MLRRYAVKKRRDVKFGREEWEVGILFLPARSRGHLQVMNMFLSSERINSDLDLAMEYPDKWTQDFVVRHGL